MQYEEKAINENIIREISAWGLMSYRDVKKVGVAKSKPPAFLI